MPRVPFDDLPGHGRLWVFPLTRDLTAAERTDVLDEVDTFLAQWAAHGAPLDSGRELRHGRFLLVGVNEDAEAPSGCSIDALVNRLRAIGDRIDVGFIDHAPVWYRDGAGVHTVSRADFRRLAREGTVDARTPVFDTSLTRISQLTDGGLERPAAESWHGRAFFGAPSGA